MTALELINRIYKAVVDNSLDGKKIKIWFETDEDRTIWEDCEILYDKTEDCLIIKPIE